ncbi:MAG: hypothetical protein NZM09_07040 [Ignavibacterium sp.]|nr:hypothetical protein [Ignavibacterium sp.]MDW8375436.1 hypothetical protein [Ignavibacteriales bacterium]
MKTFLLYYLILICSLTFAQSSSVYSRYGIGDIKHSFSTRYKALGGLGVSIYDKYHISTINPASWTSFDRTKIEFALSYNGVMVSNINKKTFTAETEVEGINFGFPVEKDLGIGVALGLIPVSRVSYKTKFNFVNSDSMISNYDITLEGKGGLSKIFIGSSVKLSNNFSIGGAFDYYFGSFRYISAIAFTNQNNFSSEYTLNYRPYGYGATLGIISSSLNELIRSEDLSNINFGISASFYSKFKTDSVITGVSSVLVDTIAQYSDYMQLPPKFNIGLSFLLKQKYLFTFDYSTQDFSKFKVFSKTSDNLQSLHKFRIGFEAQAVNELSQKLMERVLWRIGLSYEKTPYKFYDVGINQYSFLAGLSLPINPDNLIDLSFEYALRGTTDNNLIKENFFKLNVSLVFNELWFLRFEK